MEFNSDVCGRLENVFKALSIEESLRCQTIHTLQQLWTLVESENTIDKPQKSEEMKYKIGVCLLYAFSIDAKYPYGFEDPTSHEVPYSFTVTDLLQASTMNMIDFFTSMRTLRELRPVSQAVTTHLIGVEKKFLITLPLYQKFQSIAAEVFHPDDTFSTPEEGDAHDEKILWWTLFVYVKEVMMPGCRELFESFQLLLCCLDAVLQCTPAFKLKPPFDAVKIETSEKPNEPLILHALCEAYHANIAQMSKVEKIKTNCLEPIVTSLKEKDAFDVASVRGRYLQLYTEVGDVNELLFLRADPHLSVPCDVTRPETEETSRGAVTSPRSQVTPPCTPVRSALNAVQGLQALIAATSTAPSPSLLAMFKNCLVDPTQILLARVATMRQVFTRNYGQVLGRKCGAVHAGKMAAEMAEERAEAGIRLFYKQLESLLRLEEEKLSEKDFSHLLSNTTFSTCLLACSLQVVLATYTHTFDYAIQTPGRENDDASFPWILDIFEIQAFDFFKVIDSFVRAEANLPQAVVKHLQTLENKIVEKLAWKKESPLFTSLERCQVMLPAIPQTPPAGSRPEVKVSSAPYLYLSPMRPQGSVQAPATPTRDVTTGSPYKQACKSHSLSLFLNKVCKLAYGRVQKMCSLLTISKEMRNKIWTCLEYCITKRPELLQNRHLDQILMCSIYSIFKISDKEIKFKSIVAAYRQLPHSCQEVYKNIEITAGEEDSIIVFYNRVFMQKLKTYLVQFSASPLPKQVSPLTHSPLTRAPMSPMTRQLQASPVITFHGRSNFFISSLTDSPFKVPRSPGQLAPQTKMQTFSFGEGPVSSEKLKAINAAIRSPSGGTPRSQKRLKFDAPENSAATESEADVIVVRRVAQSPAGKTPNASKHDPDELSGK